MTTQVNRLFRGFSLILALVVTSRSLVGQEVERSSPKIADKNELKLEFEQVLPTLIDTQWGERLADPSFGEKGTQAFTNGLRSVKDSVAAIYLSEVEWSPRFLASMNVNYRSLLDLRNVQLANGQVSRPLYNRVLGAASDLQLKASFLTNRKSVKIPVTVRTLKSGTTTVDPGCTIWYAPFYDDREVNWDRFGQVSTSTEDLPPGIWVLWSNRKGKTGKRERLTLKVDDENKNFDIDAPENSQ